MTSNKPIRSPSSEVLEEGGARGFSLRKTVLLPLSSIIIDSHASRMLFRHAKLFVAAILAVLLLSVRALVLRQIQLEGAGHPLRGS